MDEIDIRHCRLDSYLRDCLQDVRQQRTLGQ